MATAGVVAVAVAVLVATVALPGVPVLVLLAVLVKENATRARLDEAGAAPVGRFTPLGLGGKVVSLLDPSAVLG